jgi:hypothetical protein
LHGAFRGLRWKFNQDVNAMEPKIYLLFLIFGFIIGSASLNEARALLRKRRFVRLHKAVNS